MKIRTVSYYAMAFMVIDFSFSSACAQKTASSRTPVPAATTGAVCSAAKMAGGDIGAKVNACDKSLGSNKGEIRLTGGGTIATPIIISSNHTLRVVSGTYRATSDGPVIRLKDASSLVCDSWDAVLEETTKPHTPGDLNFTIAAVYNGTSFDSLNGAPSRNVEITGCHFKGARSDFDSATQTISLSNCRDCSVTNNWLEATRTIGIQAGGGSALGNYAENVIIARNLLTNVASQNLAVTNAINVRVVDNVIRSAGQPGGPGVVPIDVEPNVGDRISNVKIVGNKIDMTATPIDQSGAKGLHGIAINNLNAVTPFDGIEVSRNTVIGANLSDPNNHISGGLILVRRGQNTVISDNTLRRGTYCILIDSGSSQVRVTGNQLSTCGSGSTESIRIVDSSNNQFLNNKLWGDPANVFDISSTSRNIVEMGTSDNNVFKANDAAIRLSGQSSRKISWNNRLTGRSPRRL